MIRLAALLAAVLMVSMAPAIAAETEAEKGSVEVLQDGTLVHHPSGIVLPRAIHTPARQGAVITKLDGTDLLVAYGRVTMRLNKPLPAVDPYMHAMDIKVDPNAPAFENIPFWGEPREPYIVSWLGDGKGQGDHWLSVSIDVGDWQLEVNAAYPASERAAYIQAIRTAWQWLAEANETRPR